MKKNILKNWHVKTNRCESIVPGIINIELLLKFERNLTNQKKMIR
jgi:hypothetical protein